MSRVRNAFSRTAQRIVTGAGSAATACVAVLLAAGWLLGGLLMGFGQGWLDVMYAISALVTLIMVFFIQHATGRHLRALSIKLDELIRVTRAADNEVMRAEHQDLDQQEHLEDQQPDRTAD